MLALLLAALLGQFDGSDVEGPIFVSRATRTCLACTCSASTNYMLRSRDFTNAAWTKQTTGTSSLPVVTASDGTATYADPAGTNLAQRVQFTACPVLNDASQIFQQATIPGANGTDSIYLRAFDGVSTVSISIAIFDSGGTATATPCTAVGSTWVRCQDTAQINTTGTPYMVFGCVNNSAYAGRSNTGAADVLVYQGQFESGNSVTCPIYTTTAAVTVSGPPCEAVCR